MIKITKLIKTNKITPHPINPSNFWQYSKEDEVVLDAVMGIINEHPNSTLYKYILTTKSSNTDEVAFWIQRPSNVYERIQTPSEIQTKIVEYSVYIHVYLNEGLQKEI